MVVPRDVVRVGGPDAASFLQGQLSQDLDAVAVGATAWSLVLQPQGKIDALVRVHRVAEDEFLLDVDGGFGDALVTRIERFKLRVKADVERVPGLVCIRSFAADRPADAVPFTWADVVAWDTFTPGEQPVDPAYEQWRVEHGVPAMGKELTEATIPEEAGVVDLAVSLTKGCYTGQELVARIDSRGRNVPRRLRRVVVDGAAEGDAVTIDGKVVGAITSAAPSVALAYVRRDVEPPAAATLAGGGVARIEALPPVT
jgi:folate-binding protein YgfZ